MWSKEGHEGGMKAKQVELGEMLDEHFSCTSPLPERSMNYANAADRDVMRLKCHLKKCSKRKSCPIHSPPAELPLIGAGAKLANGGEPGVQRTW